MIYSHYDPRFDGTSPHYYVSGMTALNIPSPTLTGGWHLTSLLSKKEVAIHLAGEGAAAFVNTNPTLGTQGVYECGHILIEMGAELPEGMKVYAADHYRSIFDLLIMAARKHQNPSFIYLPDYFDSPKEKRGVCKAVSQILSKLTAEEATHIQGWLDKQ